MKKGKFGLTFAFYTALAFALVILNQPLLCGAVALIAIFIEKEEWLSRQTLQAFLLSLCTNFLINALSSFGSASIYFSFFNVFTLLSFIIYVLSVIFAIIGIVRTLKGQEANIPLFSFIAYKAFGQNTPKYTYQPPQSTTNGYQPPFNNYPPQGGGFNPNMNVQPPVNQPPINQSPTQVPPHVTPAAPSQQPVQSAPPMQHNTEIPQDRQIHTHSDSE